MDTGINARIIAQKPRNEQIYATSNIYFVLLLVRLTWDNKLHHIEMPTLDYIQLSKLALFLIIIPSKTTLATSRLWIQIHLKLALNPSNHLSCFAPRDKTQRQSLYNITKLCSSFRLVERATFWVDILHILCTIPYRGDAGHAHDLMCTSGIALDEWRAHKTCSVICCSRQIYARGVRNRVRRESLDGHALMITVL